MLKVWKNSSHSMLLGSCQARELRKNDLEDPITLDSSSVGLTPETDSNTTPLKRTRQSSHQDHHSDTHPVRSSKRAKRTAPCPANQKHESSGAVTSASTDLLLEFAKIRNSKFTRDV